jgi:hypothetical protein
VAVVEDVCGRGGMRLISVLVEVNMLSLAAVAQKWCLLVAFCLVQHLRRQTFYSEGMAARKTSMIEAP